MNKEERVLLNLVPRVSLLPTHWSKREGVVRRETLRTRLGINGHLNEVSFSQYLPRVTTLPQKFGN